MGWSKEWSSFGILHSRKRGIVGRWKLDEIEYLYSNKAMPSGVLVQDASENCIVTGYESDIETRTVTGYAE